MPAFLCFTSKGEACFSFRAFPKSLYKIYHSGIHLESMKNTHSYFTVSIQNYNTVIDNDKQ